MREAYFCGNACLREITVEAEHNDPSLAGTEDAKSRAEGCSRLSLLEVGLAGGPRQRVVEGRGGNTSTGLSELRRETHGPRAVAAVTAKLADDRRDGVGAEVAAAIGAKAVHRLDQPDGAGLDEIVERLRGTREPACKGMDERQVLLDYL
jgi:hypothetical protein